MKNYFVLIIGTLLLIACSTPPQSTKARIQDISESVYASGNIESGDQYQVYSTVSGIIDDILVEEGQLIKKGQPLFTLSNEGVKIALESAQLNRDYANLSQNQNKLKELKFSIKAAKLKWRNDSLSYERKKMLYSKNVITGAELESAELNFQSSSSNYTSLLLQLEDLKKQLTLNDKLSMKNLSQSLKNSNDFIIKSEINGTVYSIIKNKGELITPQTPLAIVGSQNNYILKLQIDEYDIVKIKKGQQVSVRLDSYKGKVFKAIVTKISPIMNERSKTFTIDAQFINAPQTLYPNLSLEANIVINNHSKAICIPVSYLFNDNFVYLKDGSKKRVIVGLKDYDKAEIIEGLANNDEIIIPNEN